MLINSFAFGLFFLVFLVPYFALFKQSVRYQNMWLLLASYFFYGWADYRMVPLLGLVTVVYYYLGRAIDRSNQSAPKVARWLTGLSIVLGVGILLYFKYFNFFITGFSVLLGSLGLSVHASTFNIILPVGVSFFTFKLISYTVEVKRQTIRSEGDPIAFATFVAFFPTIMSGPIDRPQAFLKQLYSPRTVSSYHFVEGCKRILWGMFTKMCVADILVSYTDAVFNNLENHNITSIVFATLLYTFQIYADFNGYSNMAIGTAQIMGIKVAENFDHPYFADSVSDFWRRWHISLSTWIRDYIYIPLGGNRKGKWRMYLNQLVAMTLCGMWHGAALNFIVWGGVHGVLVCIHKFWSQTLLGHHRAYHPTGIKRFFSIIFTFLLVSSVWQLFRINSLADYTTVWQQCNKGLGTLFLSDPNVFTVGLLSTVIMMFRDFQEEFAPHLHLMYARSTAVRLVSIAFLISYIILFGALEGKTFIYFQF